MMTRLLLTLLLLSPPMINAQSQDDLSLVGQDTYRHLFFALYDARLFAPEGEYRYFSTFPFVLELEYRRDIRSEQILDASREQMDKVASPDSQQLDTWMSRLTDIIPDVSEGDTIGLRVDGERHSHFTVNDAPAGSIEDADFSRVFSGIWLSGDSSDPTFTARLLGDSD